MTSRIFPVSALLGGVALLLLGGGLLGTLVAVRAGQEGYSTAVVGLVMSAYFVGFLLGTGIAPLVIRRVGHIRAFAIFAAVASTTALVHAVWVDPWIWALLRMTTGVAIVGLYNVIESWLTTQAGSESRGSIFAVYMIVNLLAMAAGQWLILVAPPSSFELFSLVAGLVALSLVPVALTRLGQPDSTLTESVPFRAIRGAAPVAIVGGFGSGLVMGAFWGMGPLFAQRIGLDQHGVAALMSLTILGGALLQLPIGRYSDSHDRRRVVGQVAAGAALTAIAGTHALQYFPLSIYATMALYGGLVFAVYPLCAAHLSDWLDTDQLVGGSSWLLLLHGAGAAAGPLLAGWFMGVMGAGSLLLFFAGLLLPLAWFADWYAAPRRADEAISEEQSSQFVPMVRTSSAAMELLAAEEEAADAAPDWAPDADAELDEEHAETSAYEEAREDDARTEGGANPANADSPADDNGADEAVPAPVGQP